MFEPNKKKNGKGTLKPKMPFAARFSCCTMVVLPSPVKCQKSKVPVKCQKSKKGQNFQSRDIIPKRESTVSWGCKTSSLQTNCFVIDSTETQLIHHIALFHAIKEYRTNLNNFEVSFFYLHLNFAQYLIKIAVKSCT